MVALAAETKHMEMFTFVPIGMVALMVVLHVSICCHENLFSEFANVYCKHKCIDWTVALLDLNAVYYDSDKLPISVNE